MRKLSGYEFGKTQTQLKKQGCTNYAIQFSQFILGQHTRCVSSFFAEKSTAAAGSTFDARFNTRTDALQQFFDPELSV
jgi:hypothetical protein